MEYFIFLNCFLLVIFYKLMNILYVNEPGQSKVPSSLK